MTSSPIRLSESRSSCLITHTHTHSRSLVTQWDPIPVVGGHRPSARHSHAAVVHNESMYCIIHESFNFLASEWNQRYVFGGYDGAYRADFHCFDFARHRWSTVWPHSMTPISLIRAFPVVSRVGRGVRHVPTSSLPKYLCREGPQHVPLRRPRWN